jgi:aminomethyltransferase
MTLKHTPLDALHRELGARMVPFAGYDMPVQYPEGIIREHQHTRSAASLFDVSHMGQLIVRGEGAVQVLESLIPADIAGLGRHRQTYALLTNERGGVRDDLIVTRWAENSFFLVVNAACKDDDIAHLRRHLAGCELEVLEDQALLALQGPAAREVLAQLCPDVATLPFLHGLEAELDGVSVYITCSGYTGEDGFELSLPAAAAERLARRLLAVPGVAPAGLGARDSLRLEAGLCLYGHELNADIDPVQAGVLWAVSKVRRPGGERAGGFPGAEIIFARIQNRPALCRVGLAVEGKRPVREGQVVLGPDGNAVGSVCSGGFGPTVGAPIAMAYVPRDLAEPGTALAVDVRGKPQAVTVARLPFVPQRYFRG